MFNITQIWYAPTWYQWIIVILLLPLSLLFWVISSLRRMAFRLGLKKTNKVNATVIVVGNISVGGTGKTPLVVYLVRLLEQQGYSVGVLTRGYGGKSESYPLEVNQTSKVNAVGDEPMLMRQNLACPLVVDPLRSRGAKYLVEKQQCDVVICDDGLQHYALQRDIEIVVIDGKRRLGNQLLLPAGPLREGSWRLKQTDFIVINGEKALSDEYSMALQANEIINVKNPQLSCKLNELNVPLTAVAGIGNPQRFFSLLEQFSFRITQTLSFVDHHHFKAEDFPDGGIIMTEKDAVKCRDFAQDNWWYLPVSATLSKKFDTALLEKLRLIARPKH